MTYSQSIFIPGQKYRALSSFTSGPTSVFKLDDVVTFERETYSPYDNSFVYLFQDLNTGNIKEWWLVDGTSPNTWKHFFELVTN